MYSMLVVDDSPSDRNGISAMMDWDNIDVRIVGACANGAEALRVLQDVSVDIVLTDVVMPIINGIELAEQIKEKYPGIKVVFMSCYDEFSYAKSAIEVDACGYVLKPIIPEELVKVVRKLLTLRQEENRREVDKENMRKQILEMLPAAQEQFLKEMILNTFIKDETAWKKELEYLQFGILPESRVLVVSYSIDDYEDEVRCLNPEDIHYISYMVKGIITERSNAGAKSFTLQFSGGEYVSVVFLPPCDKTEESALVMDMAVDIYTRIFDVTNYSITVGLSKSSSDFSALSLLYFQSKEALKSAFYSGSSPIIHYDMIEERLDSETAYNTIVNLDELYIEVKELITMGSNSDVEALMDKLFQAGGVVMPERYVKNLTLSVVNMIAVALIDSGYSFKDILGDDTLVWNKLHNFKTIVNVREWLLNLFAAVREYPENKNDSARNTKLVEAVKQEVRMRYSEPITVGDIASALFFSKGYANSVFKRETGKTIFDYLLEYRMEKAKKLLALKESKVSDVSEKVGYENKSYFSLIFKKYVGMTPTEYKATFC